MNCQDAERLFDAYLDRELSGSLRLEFDAHRLRCTLCQQRLAMLEACEHVLARDRQTPAPSDDFTDRVMTAVAGRRPAIALARRRRWVVASAVMAQAAAVLLFAVTWLAWRQPAPSARPAAKPSDEMIAKIGTAIAERDKSQLLELMYARGNQILAARSNLQNDVFAAVNFAAQLPFLDELAESVSRLAPWGPFGEFLAPAHPDEGALADDDAAGKVSF